MKKPKISINFIAIIVAVLLILNGLAFELVTYIICITLHEFTHIFVAKKLGYKVKKFSFVLSGTAIDLDTNYIKNSHEFLIAISGPLLNIILFIIFSSLWWFFPSTYAYTFDFTICNAVLGFCNLIPAIPLDGSRILNCIIKSKTDNYKSKKIITIISFIIGVLFIGVFIATMFTKPNFSFFFFGFTIIESCFEKFGSYENDYINLINSNYIDDDINILIINKNELIYKMFKMLKTGKNNKIYVVDNNLKIVNIVLQNQIHDILIKYSSFDKIAKIKK